MGPLERLLSKAEDNNDKEDLGLAKKYAGKLHTMINNLLAISKLESGKLQLRASEIDIVKLTRTYHQAFESYAIQNSIDLQFKSEKEELKAFIDREKFEQVLNNLLSNAFKFTAEGGRIIITISLASLYPNHPAGAVQLSISDTGTGIPADNLPYIFDRFYQVEHENSSYYEGTGIGLALTKELVELHSGTISVSSEQGVGSRFEVVLPLGDEHLKREEIIEKRIEKREVITDKQSFDYPQDMQLSTNNSLEPEPGKPILIIVEDNADMRSYIRGYFEKEFQIIEAVDGVDGYEKSIEGIPDIIISDVMMPRMNGIEFCKKIKAEERTSHIPVILLTARTSKESRIEGLETGADDFITKPFDGEELQVRVKNLIDQRKRISAILERKIQKSDAFKNLDFEDSGITSMDESFLEKVFKLLKEQYSDPEFNANTFAEFIGQSRVQLNRKIKALTRHTTGEFIRTYRMNVAAEMLRKKSGTVAEIAYDVGFSSPSYFTECFRKQFGMLPSEI